MPSPDHATATIVPALRYRDANAAIDWLCRAFGFTRHAVYEDTTGGIAHAELTFGNGMIMLGSVKTGAYDDLSVHPEDVGGRSTQGIYMIVPDADAHYAVAKEAGAVIMIEIKSEDYGGRGYTCRDLEGHLWSFGTYNPWQTGQAAKD
jgi:uncharacterized glyoxalase superfamily protein PhnB